MPRGSGYKLMLHHVEELSILLYNILLTGKCNSEEVENYMKKIWGEGWKNIVARKKAEREQSPIT
jgi:hypothetical protein